MVGLIYILCTAVCLFICSRTWGISGTFQVLTDNFCSKDFTNQRGQRKVNGWEFSTEKQNRDSQDAGPLRGVQACGRGAGKVGRRIPAVVSRKETGTWCVWKEKRSFCFASALQVSLWSV